MKYTAPTPLPVLGIQKHPVPRRRLLAALGLSLLLPGALQAQNLWYGIGGNQNWSTGGNWYYGVAPTTLDTVGFPNDPTYPGVATGVVDNIVDMNFTITAMQYPTASTNGGGYHTTQINPGLALNINGTGGEALFVGSGLPTGGTINYYQRIVGPGTFTVTNTTGVIDIVQGGDNNDHFATLDLAGLTNFSASVGQIFVGCISNTAVSGLRPMGILRLAETNFIATTAGTAAPGFMVACYPTGDQNLRGTEQMLFGWHNVINSDAISIGGNKATGAITVRPGVTNGYVSLRGSAGPADKVKILGVGDGRAGMFNYNPNGTSSGNTGTFNSSGTFLDALVQDVYVPRTQTNGSGSATGTLTFDQGSLTADNFYIGYHTPGIGSAIAANATGTVNVNGNATLTVNNDLQMARKQGSSTPVATLNIATNATVNVKGNLVTSGGTSTLNFNGGTLNMQPAGDATPGSVTVSTLSGAGTILNAANVTNTSALTPGTATTVGTLTVGNNLTLSTGAVINVNFAGTTDAASNDLVNVTGNLNLNSNVVNIVPLGNSLASGTYPLFNFSGTLNGYLSFTNPTRYVLAPTYSASQVALTVSGGGPGSLKWAGTTNGVWDLATSNWVNTATSAKDKFLTFDSVTIDDSGAYTNNVLLTTTIFPNAVTVNSSTRDYTMAGSGKLSGSTALTKNGSSALVVSNVNDFTGPVYINGGTLRLGSSSAFGTSAGGVFVGPNATLDLMGTNVGSDLVTIRGTGLNNTGAVVNTGTRQDNGLRLLSLADNASVGTYGIGRYDVRGAAGNSSFSGVMDLAGYTLFKMGSTQFSVVDAVCTNPGTFEVLGGCLALTRSKVEGAGTINLYTNMLLLENNSTGYVSKAINVAGGIIRAAGNNFTLWSSITNTTGLNIDNSITLEVTNLISGAGGLTKSSGGNLILDLTPTYTGPTLISAGRLTLSNATLSATKSIALGAGATLDASAAPGGLALVSGQVLSGSGTVLGDVSVPDGTGIVPGTSAGTLTLSNNLVLNNSSNVFELSGDPTQIGNNANDLLLVNGNLTLNGVNHIKIAPLATLSTAAPYTLIQYSGTLLGGLANLVVDSDSRYSFTVVDPATTPGYIQVNVTGSGASGNLVWKGGFSGKPNAWDTKSTPNWFNTATLVSDVFYVGDNVTFDDTANTSLVTLSGPTQPAATWMKNNTLNYTFNGTGSLAMGSYTNDGGGTVSFSNTGMNTFSAATINAGTLTLANTGDNLFAAGATVNAGTVNVNNAGVNTFPAPLVVNGGSVVFNQASDAQFSGVISDGNGVGGTIEKRGANTLTLSGNNNAFNGPILVTAGTLKAANANALGTANGGTTVASGATLDINGQSLYNPGDVITISGAGVGGFGAVVNTGGNQNNAIRALNLANNATIGAFFGRWDIRGPGGNGTFSGSINLNGFTLTKVGPATNSIVDCDLTSAGNILVTGGLLGMTRCYVDGPGYINIFTNVLLLENWGATTVGYFNKPLVSSGGTLRLVGNALAIGSPITNTVGGIFMDLTQNLTVNNIITGPGLLTKLNSSTLILAYTNNYTGGTFISAGTLQIGDGASGGYDGVLPPQPLGTALTNNGTLAFNRADDITFNDQITGTGTVRQNAGGTVFLNSSNSFTGPTILATTTTTAPGGAALRISNSWALGTTNGNTQIQGNTGGNNRLELVGNLTLAEPFQLDARQQATVDIPHIENVSGTNTLTGPIVANTGGSTYNFQSDAGKLMVTANFVPPSTAGNRILQLLGDGVGEWSGVISNSTDTLVPAFLRKGGAGTWLLSGSNVYRAGTTISAGRLALTATGSINSSTNINVQAGATFDVSAVTGYTLGAAQTLQGAGTVVGAVTANGAVAPGDTNVPVATLSFANALVLKGTNIMEIDKLNLTNDMINAASLTYGGTLVLNEISSTAFALNDTFKLFNAGTYSGAFSLVLPALDSSLSWDVSKLTVDGTIKVGPASTIPLTPTNMTFVVTGNKLDISWPANYTGYSLESQTNLLSVGLSNNWFVVPGSTLTNRMVMDIDATKGTVYFRLRYTAP